jgi:hypothetical protein
MSVAKQLTGLLAEGSTVSETPTNGPNPEPIQFIFILSSPFLSGSPKLLFLHQTCLHFLLPPPPNNYSLPYILDLTNLTMQEDNKLSGFVLWDFLHFTSHKYSKQCK